MDAPMNSPTSDAELGQALRTRAAACGCSPEHFLTLAQATAEWQRHAIMPTFGPFPDPILEETITRDHLNDWPEWSARLISPGCKIEQLHWPDGTVTTRLMNPRWLVLAATIDQPEYKDSSHD
jgi:hypothetical protein